MDWEKLKTFYAVANSGSISSAENYLNRSPSAIGRQIQSLESDIEAPLFKRHKKGITLTEEGKLLFESTEAAYQKLNEVELRIRQFGKEPHGNFRVASTTSWIGSLVFDNLDSFNKSYPNIQLTFINTDYYPKFCLNEVDAAILSYIPNQAGLVQDYLMTFHLRLYASQEYIERKGMPKNEEELDNHQLITYGQENILFSSSFDWHLSLGRKDKTPRTPFLRVNSAALLHRAASKGLGIVTLPEETYSLKDSPLVPVLPQLSGSEIKAYYIYPQNRVNAANIKAFGNYLKAEINKKNWA